MEKLMKRLKEIYERFNIPIPVDVGKKPSIEEINFLIEYLCKKRNKRVLSFDVIDENDISFLELYLQ